MFKRIIVFVVTMLVFFTSIASAAPQITINNINNNDVFGTCITPNITILGELSSSRYLNGLPYYGWQLCADGPYVLHVIASDAVDTITNITYFEIDQTPPAISINEITENDCFPNSVSATFSIIDDHLKTNWATLNSSNYIAGTLIPVGTYTLYVYAQDDLDNKKTNVYHFNVVEMLPPIINVVPPAVIDKHDRDWFFNDYLFVASEKEVIIGSNMDLSLKNGTNEKPVIIVRNLNRVYYTDCITVEIEFYDEDLDINSIDINLLYNRREYIPEMTINKVSGSRIIYQLEIRDHGVYIITVNVSDKQGNSSSFGPYKFRLNITPPAIDITGVNNNTCYTDNVSIEVEVTGKYESSLVTLNDELVDNNIEVSEDNIYKLKAGVVNCSGNESSQEVNFRIDKTAPLVEIAGVEDHCLYSSADIDVKVYEDILDKEKTSIIFDGNNCISFIEGNEDNKYWNLSITGVTDIGYHELEYDVYDCAGWNTKGHMGFVIFPAFVVSDITFAASYDKTLNADYAKLDIKNHGLRYGLNENGKKNGCVNIVDDCDKDINLGLIYTNGEVINPEEGTISLYFKPDWKDINQDKKCYIFSARNKGINDNSKALINIFIDWKSEEKSYMIFQLGIDDENSNYQEMKLEINDWFESEQWIDIMFSWDIAKNMMKCYINGEKKDELEIINDVIHDARWIMFGTSGMNGEDILNGSIDEVVIFDRALSEEEVILLGR